MSIETVEDLLNALNNIGIKITGEQIENLQKIGVLPALPAQEQIAGDMVKLSIDIRQNLPPNSLAYSTIQPVQRIDATHLYKVVIGPKIIELAKKCNSLLPISFTLKHEMRHLFDHYTHTGNPIILNVAADVVINEGLFKQMKEYVNSKEDEECMKELKSMVVTLESLQETIRKKCAECNIRDCNNYMVTEDDLKAKLPTFVIYLKLSDLANRCPQIEIDLTNLSRKFHRDNEDDLDRFNRKHKNDKVEPVSKDKFHKDLEELIEPQEIELPWDELLQNTLLGAIYNAETIYPDWFKPNYRYIEYYEKEGIFIPSIEETKPPNGFVVVDSSGSISKELYSKFIGIIRNLMISVKPDQVILLFFADKLKYEQVITPDNIPPIPRYTVGSTHICDTMEYISTKMEEDNFVVVLSDFDIFDQDQCMDLITEIGRKASAAIQVVPPNGVITNKWQNWKQIIVNELL